MSSEAIDVIDTAKQNAPVQMMSTRQCAADNMRNVYYQIAHKYPHIIDNIVAKTRAVENLQLPGEDVLADLRLRGWNSEILIWNEDTINSGLRCIEEGFNPILWNFMNAEHPTGGFEGGARAQEEFICFKTTLPIPLFNLGNFDSDRKWSYPIPYFGAIITGGQVIFRDENLQMLPYDQWKTIDVVSSAAIDARDLLSDYESCYDNEMEEYRHDMKLWKRHLKKLKKKEKKERKKLKKNEAPAIKVRSRSSAQQQQQPKEQSKSNSKSNESDSGSSSDSDDEEYPKEEPVKPDHMSSSDYIDLVFSEDGDASKITRQKFRNTMLAAFSNGNDVFVAGASGCGVFANPPKRVAEIMKQELAKEPFCYMFRRVVFAITNGKNVPCKNYDIFKSIFFPEPLVPLATSGLSLDSMEQQTFQNDSPPKKREVEDDDSSEQSPSKKAKIDVEVIAPTNNESSIVSILPV